MDLAQCLPDIYFCKLQEAELSWRFDIFGFTEATPGNTLAMLTFHLVKRAGFVQLYKLDEVKLCRILQALEAGYQSDNPYHNRSEPGGLSTPYCNYDPGMFCRKCLA
jgi:hypothetical protein